MCCSTAIIGSCVQLGLSLFSSANAGLAIYTCAQFVITATCMAYSISSLRKLGVSLPVRGVILLFFSFMPMLSNYAALLTKDVLFADAFLVLLVQTVKLVACGLPRAKAQEYAAQMVLGSAKLVLESGKHPGELKDAVCSPGGSTIQGVRVLEEHAFRGAVTDAVLAAYDKTKEMGKN